MKAKIVQDGEGKFYGIRMDCPGCALIQERGSKVIVLPVDWTPPGMEQSAHNPERPRWGFNGDMEKPTLTPSILTRFGVDQVCHSFIKEGRIEFLTDCTHPLAGQTVDLPDIE